jgi:filamentous hemagglutinin family protein
MKFPKFQLFLLTFAVTANSTIVKAQSIIPANDGANSQVLFNGNTYNITGGQFSGDGQNLFHSLSQFGLNQNEIANFLSNPNIQNILTRVSGGDASVINGLIQVTGGNSNLYLMNPAGFVFGGNASLNVPGSFTATTANNIGFGNGSLFNSVGSNNYAALVGNPNSFTFTSQLPGSIFNAGNLAVANGSYLSLFAGTVVSTGSLSAPGGQVTIASVPGKNLLRLSQQGSLLSLEFSSIQNDNHNQTINSIPLAQLITGGNASSATGVKVNLDGSIDLTGSVDLTGDIKLEPGDIVAKQVTAGNATLTANNNLKLVGSNLQTTGDLNLIAKNNLIIRDESNRLNSISIKSGGDLYIQGNQGIDIFALESSRNGNKPFQSGGDLTLTSNGIISTDAHFKSGRSFQIQDLNKKTANFLSLYDPIFDVGGNYTVGNYTGASLQVTAGGNISYGLVDINAIDTAVHPTNPAFFLTAGGNITGTGDVTTSVPGGNLLVNFQAAENINVRNITTQGGDISLNSNNDSINVSNNLWTQSNIKGGEISVTAKNNINIINLSSGFLGSTTDVGNAGNINITSAAGNITIGGSIYAARANGGTLGSDGNVSLNAFNNIDVNFYGGGTVGKLVSFNSSNGQIATASIESSVANGSAINLNAANGIESINLGFFQTAGGTFNAITPGNIQFGNIYTDGGNVALDNSSGSNGFIRIFDTINTQSPTNTSGSVFLKAPGDISFTTIQANGVQGGNVDINSTGGSVSFFSRVETSSSGNGTTGGAINIFANQQISYGSSILSTFNGAATDYGNGGDISLISQGGLQTSVAFVSSNRINGGNLGRSGNITLKSVTDNNVSNYIAVNGRNIDISSTTGNINIPTNIPAFTPSVLSSDGAPGSAIRLNAPGTINLDVVLRSRGAEFKIGDVIVPSNVNFTTFGDTQTNGGAFVLNTSAPLNINQNIYTAGGDVILRGSSVTINREINTSGGNIFLTTPGALVVAQPVSAFGGSINLTGASVDTINTTLNSSNTTGSGAINITATNGEITTGEIIGGALTTTGTIQLNNNVTTTNAQFYNDAVQINGANITLTTTDSPITFNSIVEGQTPGNNSLTLNAGNANVVFNSNVGATRPLDELTIINSRANINSNVTTLNSQTYNGAFTSQGTDTTLNSLNNGSISFNADVNANGNLTVNTGGLTSFGRPVSARSLTTNAGGVTEIQNNITTTNGQSYGDAVTLTNNQTTLTNTNGAITFNNTLNGQTSGTNSLFINTDGLIFADRVGEITSLRDLTVQSQQALNFNNSVRTQTGNITINAPEITTNNINTNGGNVSLTSNSRINTTSGTINTSGVRIDSGDINILAPGELVLGNLTTFSRAGRAGEINITSQNDSITSGDLNAAGDTQGGEVQVIARTSVTTGRINSNSRLGNAGNVIIDPIGDVAVGFINAQGGSNGVGGNVDITAGRYFRASDAFTDQNGLIASISTAGSLGDGSFTLRHFGGFSAVPFDIGNPTINGTAGEITTGLTNRLERQSSRRH